MIEKIGEYKYRIPKSFKSGMKLDGIIYADDDLIQNMQKDQTLEQVANVATLPGFINHSIAMPDAHQGYGFCIGGVAAADADKGVVSAGGVGFDINCGVRLLTSPFDEKEIQPKLKELIDELFKNIPTGTGKDGKIKLSKSELESVIINGASWTLQNHYANESDLEFIEDHGCLKYTRVGSVSEKAILRGKDQLGTLGSGNHFLEIQVVDDIFDEEAANRYGLYLGQITVLIHSGSRGLGHQVCTDYLEIMDRYIKKNSISLVDRQLSCVPINSQEGENYLAAMAASANFAFANRQCMTHWTREVFQRIMGSSNLRLVYDLGHNIAKFENHKVDGVIKKLLVHRKGATRAFGKGNINIPSGYMDIGQPVLIPGSMGTHSYVLKGTDKAMDEAFGSSCHGAGRTKSRTKAKSEITASEVLNNLKNYGVIARAQSKEGLTEENPSAYKDVDTVVNVVHNTGIALKVCRLRPIGVIKG
jgi:tRNA-splicing ligase RtcB (3'-phosphate/5'-hydroxy nucleic acid ligase)